MAEAAVVAVVKRSQAKEKSLSAMLDEAKGANCEGALKRAANAGHDARPGRQCAIHAIGFQTHDQRGGDRR